jgi:hypothetical protein
MRKGLIKDPLSSSEDKPPETPGTLTGITLIRYESNP